MAGIKKQTERRYTITISAGTVYELSLDRDTKPNVIQTWNRGSFNIYISDSSNVSASSFDKQLSANGNGVITYPVGIEKLYFYSSNSATLDIRTYESDELYSADLDRTQETVITNSTTTSNVSISEGGFVTFGSQTDPMQTTVSTNKTFMSYVKGLIHRLNDLISLLPTALTGSGNLKTAIQEAIPAGTNNIGDVDVLTLPSLPAGTNNIGDVDVLSVPVTQTPAGTVTIYNVTLTSANTEYSQALPSNTKKFSVSIMDGDVADNFRIAYETGKVATPTPPYLKYPQSTEYSEDNIFLSSGTIYIASSIAGKTAQIIVWS